MTYNLIFGDCLEVMRTLEAGSVDGIFTDVPYGTTACSWDTIIPLEPMWEQVKRLLKPNGAFITTASQPFTSVLVMSNLGWFKYDDVWVKDKATGHLNANVMPMRKHESVLVFGEGKILYNPQITRKPAENVRPVSRRAPTSSYGKYNETAKRNIPLDMSYPVSVFHCNTTNHGERGHHPTQKPVSLYERIILTYSNPGDTIIDFAMGSGTTGVACMRTGRNFIGIENHRPYFEIAEQRIAEAAQQPPLFVEQPAPAAQFEQAEFDSLE